MSATILTCILPALLLTWTMAHILVPESLLEFEVHSFIAGFRRICDGTVLPKAQALSTKRLELELSRSNECPDKVLGLIRRLFDKLV